MKKLILIFLLCFFNFSNAQKKPQKIFKENLLIIERFVDSKIIYGDSLNKAVTFLEELTNIKSNTSQQYDELIAPNEQNLKDWTNWFDKNKSILYWDKSKSKVQKRGTEINVQKVLTPKEIFLKNLSVFEEINNGGTADLNTIYESREFLIQITGITYEMEQAFDMPILPTKETVDKWKSWFEINKENLYWDSSENKVIVKSKK